ncbi:MAG: Gfo/Idh/MocA family oxidoreductase [Saprospiraceae bacterium]|nr:Gfo/Idh/MocA family oxidoreductase [Saprospiraceae bacterium]
MKKTKVGIVGLGRLGKEYARNLSFRIRSADLIAACSISEEELDFARTELEVPHLFKDYEEMLKLQELEAIFVISSTNKHAEHIVKALQAGLHVYSEKPLSSSIEECKMVEAVAAQYPKQLAVVGFVRRFDPSYRYAKQKIEEGAIGKPYLVRSQTIDKDTVAAWQIQYVKSSGGIFHDYNVHDIDLARWFLGAEVESVWSLGGAYKYPAFEEAGDADHVMSTCRFENGTMAVLNAGRTAMVGHDTYTEVVGTLGTLRIGRPAAVNRVEVYDQHGARQECVETFWDRFEEAFLRIAEDFLTCIQEGRQPELTLSDARQATLVAEACTRSFQKGELIKVKELA